jgi:hypothetical protein
VELVRLYVFKIYNVRLQISSFGASKALPVRIHLNSEMFLKHAKLVLPRARAVREKAGCLHLGK